MSDERLHSSNGSEWPVFLASQPSQVEPAKRRRLIVPAILFLSTIFTTLVAGFLMQLNFSASTQEEFSAGLVQVFNHPTSLIAGLPFAGSVLLILVAHEMGHYLTCRYYHIRATVPYVIPAPPPIVPFGTFGAVIKIKSLFRDRKQLFDVGIAGPLAGFVFIIPVLIIGLAYSTELKFSAVSSPTIEFGEPLLFQLAAGLFFPGDSTYLNLHPVGWAAWFGMLATSLNLLPIGQLDGGHIIYSLLGARWHRIVSYVTFGSLILLSAYSWPVMGYLLFALILLFLRFQHPRPYVDAPLQSRGRHLLAFASLVIFVITFIPIPVKIVENVGHI